MKYNSIGAELRVVSVAGDRNEREYVAPWTYTWYANNVGYARSCNEAARDLSGDHPEIDTFAFFNADTELREGVLESCLGTLWSDITYAVVGPKQVTRQNRICHGGIFNETRPQHRGWQQPDTGQFADIRDDCCTVSGSAYFVRRSVWEELTACPIYQECFPREIGAFAPTPLYYEETTCSYHARSHGYKIVYDGRVTMVHDWTPNTSAYAMQCMSKSREMFRKFCDAHKISRD
jgi:GT2 family glycosyltransferase